MLYVTDHCPAPRRTTDGSGERSAITGHDADQMAPFITYIYKYIQVSIYTHARAIILVLLFFFFFSFYYYY